MNQEAENENGAGESGRSSFAGVLSLVETHGSVVVFARSLETLASANARAALHAAGVIASAQPAPTWPCDVRGCSREIRGNYDGAKKPLVAVCCQAPAVCTPVELGFDEVAQSQVSVEALLVAACALLGATVDRAGLAKVRERHAIGELRAPVLVATLDEPRRDVFWAGSPRDTDLSAWCARRERASRRTLVFVPTPKYVPLDVLARFARGEVVEVCALDDLLEARGAKLALVDEARRPAPKLAPPPVAAAPAAPGLAALLGATRWEEIRISVVDGHTVRIECGEKKLLRTFVELGFVDGRKTDVVTATTAWSMLLLFCRTGRIKPSEYSAHGKAYGAKKVIERLGIAMRGSFGLAEHPIHEYSRRGGLWEARFRVAEGA
ncbi:MAG: hypothetical protein ACLQVI_29140 [Polyangiaceae bacterium]